MFEMKTRMIIEFMVLSLEAGLAAGETGTYKGLVCLKHEYEYIDIVWINELQKGDIYDI